MAAAARKKAGQAPREVHCHIEGCSWSFKGTAAATQVRLESHLKSWHPLRPVAKRTPVFPLEAKQLGKPFTWQCLHCDLGLHEPPNTRKAALRRSKHHAKCHPSKPASDFSLRRKHGGSHVVSRCSSDADFQRICAGLRAAGQQRRLLALRARGHDVVRAANPCSPGVRWQACRKCYLSAEQSTLAWWLPCVQTSYRRPAFAKRQLAEWEEYFRLNPRKPTDQEMVHRDILEKAAAIVRPSHRWEPLSDGREVCSDCGALRAAGLNLVRAMVLGCGLDALPNATFHKLYKIMKKQLSAKANASDTRLLKIAAQKWALQAQKRKLQQPPSRQIKPGVRCELTADNLVAVNAAEPKRRRF